LSIWCCQGIAKLDLTTPVGVKEAAVATIEYDGLKGGEAFFVPRSANLEQSEGGGGFGVT
jgi:hypothetical protein